METICEECGKPISNRAKANVWNAERVVCTPCLHKLEAVIQRQQAGIGLAGKAGEPWLVDNGTQQMGPYTTEQLIAMLASGQVDWLWRIWREGMWKWVPVAQLFTIPELSGGKLELREMGQGDGRRRETPPG